MRATISLLAIATIYLFTTCDSYEFPGPAYPQVNTLAPADISAEGVTLKANVTYLGNKGVLDHGFVWGFNQSLRLTNADNVHLGLFENTGVFEAVVLSGLHADSTYFVKAFVTDGEFVVYGNVESFKSRGSKSPVVTSFSPAAGKPGDQVTIAGNYFSALEKNNIVKFGTFVAEVKESTNTTITCVVPSNIANKTVNINVTVGGKTTQASGIFTMQ